MPTGLLLPNTTEITTTSNTAAVPEYGAMMPRNAVPVYTAASLCGRPDTNTVRDWLKPMEHSFIATADRRQNDHAAIAMMRGDFVQSGRRGILDVLAGETHTIRHLMAATTASCAGAPDSNNWYPASRARCRSSSTWAMRSGVLRLPRLPAPA